MSKKDIKDKYQIELNYINKQIATIDEVKTELQSNINQFTSPIAQLDKIIAEITVNINKKIYEISGISSSAVICGCGTYMTDEDSNQISVGTTYYYEQAKSHRMNIEDTSYADTDPFGKLNQTDGSVAFNSGIGSETIVVGADQNSILELIVSNNGSGFISSTYYGRTLVGGAGTGAKADIVVSVGGSVSSVIINNGGTGYAINNILTISSFAGATFTVTNVGSPILGIGVDTYIVASSGIGSIFIPTINSTESSTCGIGSTCGDFASQISAINVGIASLRIKRKNVLDYTNTLKIENRKYYTQRYGYIFGVGEISKRKNTVNNIITTLNALDFN